MYIQCQLFLFFDRFVFSSFTAKCFSPKELAWQVFSGITIAICFSVDWKCFLKG